MSSNITPGKYLAKAIKAELSKSGTKGTPCIAVEFQLLETGQFIWDNWWLTEKAAKQTAEKMKRCGYHGAKIDGDLMADGMGANEVELVIELENYEGKDRPRVKWVNDPNGGGGGAKLEGGEAKAIAAKMRGILLAQGGTDAPAQEAPAGDVPW